MDSLPKLPLPVEELPQAVRRFGDPNAPGPARTMAAKGLVPIKGADLVTLLAQLSADPDATISGAAAKTLEGLPEAVLLGACEGELHAAVIDALTRRFAKKADVIERLVRNKATADETLARIATSCDESVSELIATNQVRLLEAPKIIEALYKNPNTRMSTADRLIELCARNDVSLDGIPAFKAHVEAIQGQLIPEPTDEPLPSDQRFRETLEQDDHDDPNAVEETEEGEEVNSKTRPLQFQISQMSISEKIRLATLGQAAARAILVRDPNRLVSNAAISSPRMSDVEATSISHSKEVSSDVLRYIGHKKEWIRNYEVKHALVNNPKTPVALAMRLIPHLRAPDLKAVTKSRNVPPPVKIAARQRLQLKEKKA